MSKAFSEYTDIGRKRPEGRDVKNREKRKKETIRTSVRMPEFMHEEIEAKVNDGTFKSRSEAIRFSCLLMLLYLE